jgi:hypothetical protein
MVIRSRAGGRAPHRQVVMVVRADNPRQHADRETGTVAGLVSASMKKTVRITAIGAALAIALLAAACQPAPGAGTSSPTVGASSAPAATPTALTY